jgi:demethylmenaquinone methyltransferase / 2-methoxy-6-polyprenyl-1,4-benzoquinol methylase
MSSTTQTPPPAAPPHPMIERYYATGDQKRVFLRSIFDDTAGDYDRVERWLSLGSGSWYRRQALRRAGLSQGMSVVDVAMGTGLVTREARALVGPDASIIGIDPSPGMMAQSNLNITSHVARAEAIPVPDASADFVSMGYALRHLEDLVVAFREFARVLKPGGTVCILEITKPRSRIGQFGMKAYLSTLGATVGLFTKLSPRTPELWSYYWQTKKCSKR